MTRQALGF